MFNEKEADHTEAELYGADYKLLATCDLMRGDSYNDWCCFLIAETDLKHRAWAGRFQDPFLHLITHRKH